MDVKFCGREEMKKAVAVVLVALVAASSLNAQEVITLSQGQNVKV